MSKKARAILIGCGMIGAKFACDTVMARHIAFSSHAQVLGAHPGISWEAAVDPNPEALDFVGNTWNVPVRVESVDSLPRDFKADIAVICTPPDTRSGLLEALSGVKCVFVEKPLGVSLDKGRAFIEACERSGIRTQVNFWRRGDELFSRLAAGELKEMIGRPYAVNGVYGNGIMNNGSHMIDFVRMLLGEVSNAEALDTECAFVEGPVPGDRNFSFKLIMADGLSVVFQAIPYDSYRELGLEIWGEKGRLAILQEGLGVRFFPKRPNRAMEREWEVASDEPIDFEHTCGKALYRMYDNMLEALNGGKLVSSGRSALETEAIVHRLLDAC